MAHPFSAACPRLLPGIVLLSHFCFDFSSHHLFPGGPWPGSSSPLGPSGAGPFWGHLHGPDGTGGSWSCLCGPELEVVTNPLVSSSFIET